MDHLDPWALGDLLLKEGISCQVVATLEEENINGEDLLQLITDLSEFKEVLSKAGDRLAVKRVVKKFQKPDKGPEEATNLHDNAENDDGKCSHQPPSHKAPTKRKAPEEDNNDNRGRELNHQPSGQETSGQETSGQETSGQETSGKETATPPEKRKRLELNTPIFNINKVTLPSFSKKTRAAIESGDVANTLQRLAFVRECVAYYEPILPYPTAEQYTAIAQALLKAVPCLRDRSTIYWETLKNQLMLRFRNIRRGSAAAKKQKTKGFQLPAGAVQPLRTEGGEEQEYQEAIQALQKLFEGNTVAPSATVQSLMDATRPHRNRLLSTSVSITEILKTYPPLKTPKWLMYEFQKVHEVEEPQREEMKKNWLDICQKLLGKPVDGIFENELKVLDIIVKNINHKPPINSVVKVTPATGNIGDHFVSMLMEPRLLVFTDDGAISQMILCAENEEIMEVPGATLMDGVLHLMAAYYVYGVEYPKGCKSLLYFFQDFIIQKPDVAGAARKRPTRYKTFTSQLHCNYSCS